METAAEINVLAKSDPVPLDLLVRSNLVQQELTRLCINSIALLNKTVNVEPDVMRSEPTSELDTERFKFEDFECGTS